MEYSQLRRPLRSLKEKRRNQPYVNVRRSSLQKMAKDRAVYLGKADRIYGLCELGVIEDGELYTHPSSEIIFRKLPTSPTEDFPVSSCIRVLTYRNDPRSSIH